MKRQNRIIRITALFLSVLMCFVTIPAQAEEEMPDNGIPVITINIDESQGTIEDMIASEDHSVYCCGKLSIDVPEGFHYADIDMDLQSYENLAMSIRGRGNSTWNRKEKKPLKIKLDKKENLFGFGKNKHWALLANAFDPSLIRNRITFWLSGKMAFEYTPQGVPVDVVMKGEQYGTKYLGSYYLCENIRVDDNRLEIDELEEDDTEMPAISGGYLVQDARQVPEWSPNRFNTERGVAWATETPSFDVSDGGYENEAQKTYIMNHLNTVEEAIYSGGEEYRDLVDVESAAAYWLMNTLAMNLDAYDTSSTYIYKKRDVNGVTGKVYWGPVWDFDYAYDKGETYEGFGALHPWMKPLFTDRTAGGFLEEVQKQWAELRENAEYVVSDGGLIDQYYEETKLSAENDHVINPDEEDTSPEYSYREKTENLKTWLKNRLAWLDANIDSIDDMVHTITYVIDGEIAAKDYCQKDGSVMVLPLEPRKEGYAFMGWEDDEGNPVEFDIMTDHDMTVTAKFIPESETVKPEDIIFAKNGDVVRYDPDNKVYIMDWEVLPGDAYDKTVDWLSSDESISSVNESGEVLINTPGTVTITAVTHNGIRKEFTLTITEEAIPLPEAITPEHEVIHMTVGEWTPIVINREPALSKVDEYSYESEDYDIADVDFYGVVKAVAVGTVRIHVQSSTYTEEDPHMCETWVTVIVSETPFVPEYTVVSGDQTSWKKGTEEGITLTVKRNEEDETCFSHFKGVLMDEKELIRDTDYTAVSGSTVITIHAATLDVQSEGEHTVTAVFDDGKAETKLTIEKAETPQPSPEPTVTPSPAPEPSGTPSTGDTSNPALWTGLIAGSAAVIVICLILRNKLMK